MICCQENFLNCGDKAGNIFGSDVLDSKAERVGIFLSAHLKPQKVWIPLNSESFHDLLTSLEIILYSMVTLSKSKFDYIGEWYDGEV